ncbi:MAG: secretin N-terminal domain-containing protein [bacterium]
MSKSYKNMSKLVLSVCLLGYLGLNPLLSIADEIDLKKSINNNSPDIQLRGSVKIDKNQQIITLNLRDANCRQVLRMLADKAGFNIILHDSVNGKLTLDLANVTLNKAFEYIMTLNGLTYWKDGNTLIVASKSVAAGLGLNKSQIKSIGIKYLDAADVAGFLNNNIFSLNRPDISSSGIVISNPRGNQIFIFGNENDIALAQKTVELIDIKPLMKTFEINYANPENIASDICTTVFSTSGASASSTSTSSSIGASGDTSASTSSAGSTSTFEGNKIICSGASSTTASSATTSSTGADPTSGEGFSGINTTLSSLNATGFIVMANDDLSQVSITGTPEQINQAEELIKKFDKKQPQIYIEISIVELNETGSKAFETTLSTGKGNFFGSFGGGLTSYHYSDSSQLAKSMSNTLETLIQQRRGRVLSNPRIIATNNKTSTVNISSDFVEKKTSTITTSGNNTLITENYEVKDSGIKLSLTPRISPNGYITINLVPSYTSQKEQIKNGNEILVTLLNKRDLNLSNIRIKDGETLVLGGLIQEIDANTNVKMPLLGDVPIIGALFKSSSTDKERSELIIMITPVIIKEDSNISADAV